MRNISSREKRDKEQVGERERHCTQNPTSLFAHDGRKCNKPARKKERERNETNFKKKKKKKVPTPWKSVQVKWKKKRGKNKKWAAC